MNDVDTHPLLRTVRWLSQHAGFPASRLNKGAETMILVATVAAAEHTVPTGGGRFLIESRDGPRDAALRANQERRKLTHFKCDNSAKV